MKHVKSILGELESKLLEADGQDKRITCAGCGIHPRCDFEMSYGGRIWGSGGPPEWVLRPVNHEMGGWVTFGKSPYTVEERNDGHICPSCLKTRVYARAEGNGGGE